jgi:hypothetical protein
VLYPHHNKLLPYALEKYLALHRSVRQFWFTGIYSDVGGDYTKRGLGDVTLVWMLDAVTEYGLCVDRVARAMLQPDPLAPMHESHKGVWRVLGKHARGSARVGMTRSFTRLRSFELKRILNTARPIFRPERGGGCREWSWYGGWGLSALRSHSPNNRPLHHA